MNSLNSLIRNLKRKEMCSSLSFSRVRRKETNYTIKKNTKRRFSTRNFSPINVSFHFFTPSPIRGDILLPMVIIQAKPYVSSVVWWKWLWNRNFARKERREKKKVKCDFSTEIRWMVMKGFCFVTLELGAVYKNNVTSISMKTQSALADHIVSHSDTISALIFMQN